MQRRDFATIVATVATGTFLNPLKAMSVDIDSLPYIATMANTGLPENLPANITVMIKKVLANDFKAINTDWFGSIQIEGLLRFANRGFKEGYEYANNWFNFHVEHDG